MSLRTLLVMSATLAVALLFTAFRLPPEFPGVLAWLRPDWVAIVVLYWVIAVPQQVGMTTAWVAGLLVDSVTGNLLGQHALGLVIVAFTGLTLYERLRMFSMLQQAFIVFVTVSIAQLIDLLVEIMTRDAAFTLWVFGPAVVSALLWPVAFDVLRAIRRRARIR